MRRTGRTPTWCHHCVIAAASAGGAICGCRSEHSIAPPPRWARSPLMVCQSAPPATLARAVRCWEPSSSSPECVVERGVAGRITATDTRRHLDVDQRANASCRVGVDERPSCAWCGGPQNGRSSLMIYLFCCSFARRVYVGLWAASQRHEQTQKLEISYRAGAFATARAAEVTMSTNN